MKFEHTEVFNFEGAIRGMRNPKESWSKSDSHSCAPCPQKDCQQKVSNCSNYVVGKNDLSLMQKLIKAGSEHRKFMRQIFVSTDVTAPIFWWKEMDQYRINVTTNSCSTMHKLAETPITLDCFEFSAFDNEQVEWWHNTIEFLERLRVKYNETKDKRCWKALIMTLPESWLQKRTITMNYENLLNMCSKGQRRFHKLTEWSVDFINWARSLPYAQELIFLDELEGNK